jgi:hypothetical protein
MGHRDKRRRDAQVTTTSHANLHPRVLVHLNRAVSGSTTAGGLTPPVPRARFMSREPCMFQRDRGRVGPSGGSPLVDLRSDIAAQGRHSPSQLALRTVAAAARRTRV